MSVDWHGLFTPSVPFLETFVRGTVVYLALFALLRFVLKREAGAVGVTDMLVIVLIADAAQNAMAGSYVSILDGILLVAVIIFWSFFLDAVGYWWPPLGRVLHPPALELVRNGRLLPRNLRREFITKEELMSQIRQQGVEDLAHVKRAYLEGDGRISVISDQSAQQRGPQRRSEGT